MTNPIQMIPKLETQIDQAIEWDIDFWIEEKHLKDEPEQQELFEDVNVD